MTRILFVCLGNICRSPAAEAIVADLARRRGVDDVVVDSAGTASYHVGDPPHADTVAEARHRGVPIDHRGRQVEARDFTDFDLLVAMDRSTARNLRAMAPRGADLDRIVLFGSFAPDPASAGVADVADPWGLSHDAYVTMWDQLTVLSHGLLDHLEASEVT
jgi:protein-tyrosine phosphatase